MLPWERYEVLARIAALNGIKTIPSQGSLDLSDRGNVRERILEMAKVSTRAEQPLSPKLESLARGALIRPDLLSFWGHIWPRVVVIPILWIALYTGFWIVSGFQTRPVR